MKRIHQLKLEWLNLGPPNIEGPNIQHLDLEGPNLKWLRLKKLTSNVTQLRIRPNIKNWTSNLNEERANFEQILNYESEPPMGLVRNF
jgi:hypothetical protein